MRGFFALIFIFIGCAHKMPPPPPVAEPVVAKPPPEGPPWTRPPVALGAVEQAYLTSWQRAGNKTRCPLVVASDLGGVGGATQRPAEFGEGWGVAYDALGLRGAEESGKACETCGRAAFGVAATAATTDSGLPKWDNEIRWGDGSRAVYRRAESGWYVAYLEIHGVDCLYYVWSTVSEQHLQALLNGLRRVQGM